jgi:hypothetical protein
MIDNKYILILALIFSIPLIIAWSFNHINPWFAYLVGFATLFLINQTIKTIKNKNKNKNENKN